MTAAKKIARRSPSPVEETDIEHSDVYAYRLLMADVYELAGLSRRISEREAAAQGATVARWHVLSVASEHPVQVPEIARRLGQVRQGVQRVVDELVEDGYLTRRPNPAHARSPLFAISPHGRVLLERLCANSERTRGDALERAGLDTASLMDAREKIRALIESLRDLA
ncbi:MAG TPA: MarR family transcriptional regulator [Nocardioidaceae bacterium]|jgi:DNA-binding MarR family transcriptional regulator